MNNSEFNRNDFLSELRSSEAENDLRKKLEEKLRKTRDRIAAWSSTKAESKSRVNVQSVVTLPNSRSAKSPSRCFEEEHVSRHERITGPSTSDKILNSTVSVVRNNTTHQGSNSNSYRPSSSIYKRTWRRQSTPSTSRGSRFAYRSSYTGYDHRNASPSRSPELEPGPSGRPSSSSSSPPPKDMPEHIRWLHDRWSRYDRNFFTDAKSKPQSTVGKFSSSEAQDKSYEGDMAEYKRTRAQSNGPTTKRRKSEDHQKPSTSRNTDSYSSYFDWHHGGGGSGSSSSDRRNDIPALMMSFKEFLLSYPTEIDDQDTAVALYNDYKLDFRIRAFDDFYRRHHNEEWFLEKYNPVHKAKKEARRREVVGKRLEIFMNLLVRGWIETHVDYTESRHVRKLLDAACVLLEGGTEKDIQSLSDFDYILEEKREESYDVERLISEAAENEFKDTIEEGKYAQIDVAKAEKRPVNEDALNSDGELDEDLQNTRAELDKKATELELMQHARDYTLYVKKHTQTLYDMPQDVVDLPDSISCDKTETRYVGEGMFVSQVTSGRNPNETTLHKAASLCIRNIDPNVSRAELEALCAEAHGGFVRLYLSQPDPRNNFCRSAIASFWHNANLMKILWILRGKKLHGKPLMVFEYRDFKKRVELVDGLAADKSVVLRDIQLCKSLIEYLDKRNELWVDENAGEGVVVNGSPKINPLLVNLDQCLAFHLQELIKSGKISAAATEAGVLDTISTDKSGRKVDRDENLTKILDRLILYLRIVHSVDYYGCTFYEYEDDEPKRISTVHLRGPASRVASPKSLAIYIKEFEERLKLLLPTEARLADEHVELFGKKYYEIEVDKYVEDNIVSVLDGMTKCCVCYKRFTTRDFARSHMKDKHEDKLKEVRVIVAMYNNYLADPNRPCHVDFS